MLEVAPGGAVSSTRRYLHLDRLGSPALVTDEAGAVVERRSYAPFGAARDPDWASDAPPGPVQTEVGFTGHDDDEGLGLVNMKGRVYDPRLARFLTPDPMVQAPLLSASWHRYSYVWNNPLVFTDPTGFQVGHQEAPDSIEAMARRFEVEDQATPGYDPSAGRASGATRAQQASPAGHREAATNGPVGPGATAGGAGNDLVPAFGLGLAAGLSQNLVPFGSQLPFPKGPAVFELGRHVGVTLGGLLQLVEGLGLGAGGLAATATGPGAALGVPALVEAGVALASGAVAVATGIAGGARALEALNANNSFSTGSGSSGVPGGVKLDPTGVPLKPGSSGGPTAEKKFDPDTKALVRAENRATHDGKLTCVLCGRDDLIDPPGKHTRGQPIPKNEAKVDHIISRHKGGNATQENGQVVCQNCNQDKYNRERQL